MDATNSIPILAIGLMSGTSGDGVDAAIVKTNGESQFEFLKAITLPYDQQLRQRILRIAQSDVALNEVLRVEREVTQHHVTACKLLLQEQPGLQPDVIGFHGHTIRHVPAERLTWQIGDASKLAAAMKCCVVSDFRKRDLAAGGQGAPLAPLFHQQLLANTTANKCPAVVLNLGGVANVTWLGDNGEILAGDVGPGCGLLDAWSLQQLGEPYDANGELASQGEVQRHVVEATMAQPFFQARLPKSADRFQFAVQDIDKLSAEDGAATLCAITVAGIKTAVQQHLPQHPNFVWVCGGGVHHPVIMAMLRDEFENVEPIEAAGLRSDSLEAECFAWLAVRRLRGLPTSLPETTGCVQPTCGGLISCR